MPAPNVKPKIIILVFLTRRKSDNISNTSRGNNNNNNNTNTKAVQVNYASTHHYSRLPLVKLLIQKKMLRLIFV